MKTAIIGKRWQRSFVCQRSCWLWLSRLKHKDVQWQLSSCDPCL